MAIKRTMQLLIPSLFLFSLALAVTGTESSSSSATATATKTTTHLRFYMHDVITATPPSYPVATAVQVINGTVPLPNDPTTHFGDMFAIDDLLTAGPDPTAPSAEVGRVQGFFQFASLTEYALLLSANFVFTAGSGKHNGSTVAVLARDVIFDDVRELPVVGGTGGFRGATGYGLMRTHSIDTVGKNAVLLIDLYLDV